MEWSSDMSNKTIRPIHDDAGHAMALAEIETLMDAKPGTERGDRLDVLVTLVDAYESHAHAIDAPDPIALIEHVMEARGLSRKDIEPQIGSSGRVSEVLGRKRPLTLGMIRALHKSYRVPADALITEYPLKKKTHGQAT